MASSSTNNVFLSFWCCILNSQNDSFYKVFVAFYGELTMGVCTRCLCWSMWFELLKVSILQCQHISFNMLHYWAYFILFISSFGSKMYLCIVYYYILIYIDSLPLTISYLYNEHSLLENTPWEPVGNILRHRFSNRFPQTETNGLVFRHWVFSTGALGFHWYRLERPAGIKEAATLT